MTPLPDFGQGPTSGRQSGSGVISLSQALEKLVSREDLSEKESFEIAQEILKGAVPSAGIAGLLTALRSKGETVNEITGFARALRESMTRVSTGGKIVADTCGTGGDSRGTFNISTAAAFVAAGAGIPVAKHGNRSISSKCGSADVLEALGVRIDMAKEQAEKCLAETGIVFLFAPHYHPAMKHVAPVRKELGIRTIFNILGPLANPAGAAAQVIGTPRENLVGILSKTLQKLNSKEGTCTIVLSENGYDELVLQGKETAMEIHNGRLKKISLGPKDFGLKKASLAVLKGGDAKENSRILVDFLQGKRKDLEDVILANAALAIYCAQKAVGKIANLKGSLRMARESLALGAARRKLECLIEAGRD